MDILFVLLGLAIFYAAAAVFAIDHYETNPAQAAVSFVIPPFAWWLYYHRWQSSKKIAFTQIVAILLFFAGLVLSIWFSDSEIKILKTQVGGMTKGFDSSGYVGSDASLKELAQAERVSKNLNGRIRGKTFVFDKKTDVAEFDGMGTLRIKHGDDFFGDFEIAIELKELPPLSKNPWIKTIRVDSPNPPAIYISWYDKDEQLLRSRKYQGAYNLDLSLKHEEYNMFFGKLQLVLPDPEQSFLVGSLPVFNSRLRFHGEGINKEYDSVETLEVLASHSLNTTYKNNVKKILGFKYTDFDYLSGDGLGRSNVYVQDDADMIRAIPLQFYKNDRGWFLDIKGLKNQLTATDNLIAFAPQGLSQAIRIDSKNIGNINTDDIQALEKLSQQPASLMQSNTAEILFEEGIKTESQLTEKSANQAAPSEIVKEAQKITTRIQADDQPINLKIDIIAQETNIVDLLLPLMNKEVELITQEGKFKTGIYVGVHRKQVVLELEVGGGSVEFLTDFHNMKSLRVLNSNSTKPSFVEFFNPNAF